MKFIFLLMMTSTLSMAQGGKDPYLSTEDQKYYKNDVMEGNNQFERINMNVKEINRIHGELASLKAEVQQLKKEITELKKR